MHSLFISDLHLCAEHPRTAQAFLDFAKQHAINAEALYILGDLFEYWAGDDDLDDPFHRQIVDALRAVSTGGVRVYLMHGNRDLLIGRALEQACGATLLQAPALIDLYGTPTLLTHGDTLCTDDVAYQAYRREVHDPARQRDFLALPLGQRKAYIKNLRSQSEVEKQHKSSEIMDVNDEAVACLLRSHNYPRLIHGHTHRPNRHLHIVDGHHCERWVLGDWDTAGNFLRCDESGCKRLIVETPFLE